MGSVTIASSLKINFCQLPVITILLRWGPLFLLLIVLRMSKYTTVSFLNLFFIVDIGNKTSLSYLVQQHIMKNQKVVSGLHTPYGHPSKNSLSGNFKNQGKRKKSSRSRYVSANEEFIISEEDNYICTRKFCSFCLKTNYEENFSHCYNNNQWICPFCQGVCFCTRCLR